MRMRVRWLALWLGLCLLVGCGTAQGHAVATPTDPPDPTQPAAPTGLPANLPLPNNAMFQAQQVSLTLPLRASVATTQITWIWSVPVTQSALISFYQANLPKNGWTHMIMAEMGDGPTLSACGKSADGMQIILDVEAALSITGNDLAGIKQTYIALSGSTLLIVGAIPSTDCAILLAP